MDQLINILKEPFVELPQDVVINKQLRPLVWAGVGVLIAKLL